MLKIEDLEGIKLVHNEEYIATEAEAQQSLENVFQQASQSWGIRREEGVILKLARDLKIALALANVAEENGRMLKGAQMELGRVKKQRDAALAHVEEVTKYNVDLAVEAEENREEIAKLILSNTELAANVSFLEEDGANLQGG